MVAQWLPNQILSLVLWLKKQEKEIGMSWHKHLWKKKLLRTFVALCFYLLGQPQWSQSYFIISSCPCSTLTTQSSTAQCRSKYLPLLGLSVMKVFCTAKCVTHQNIQNTGKENLEMDSLHAVFEVVNNGLLHFLRLALKLQSHCCKKESPEQDNFQTKPPLSRSTISGAFNLQWHFRMTLTF